MNKIKNTVIYKMRQKVLIFVKFKNEKKKVSKKKRAKISEKCFQRLFLKRGIAESTKKEDRIN